MTRFNLPDLGEGLQEAEIVRWHVAVGDAVTVDQPMVAMETAKAIVEVPSPVAGVIQALHGKPGDTIATGAPLVDFVAQALPSAPPPVAQGTVVGHMPVTDELLPDNALPRSVRGGPARTRAVPAARELARRLDIDLARITGSGRDGLVTLDDVLQWSGGAATPAPASRLQLATSSMRPATNLSETGEIEVLRSLRRAMAQSMTLARDNVMECTVFDDADIEGWKQAGDYTVRLLRSIAAGCRAEPGLNAWFDGSSQGRRLFHHIQVGIAVDTPDGLLVPVIRDVGNS